MTENEHLQHEVKRLTRLLKKYGKCLACRHSQKGLMMEPCNSCMHAAHITYEFLPNWEVTNET